MGCDIHIYVQKRDDEGNWQPVERPFYNEKWDWRDWAPWDREEGIPDPGRRNYDVFAFLADVRNEGNIEPKFAGRGVPPDNASGTTYLGDHSFTWATLDELLAAPWDVTVKETGLVEVEGYRAWKKDGHPDSWFGYGGGPFIADHAEFEKAILAGNLPRFATTKVSWEWQPLANCDFRRWCETFLRELAGDDLSSVRVTMGFDS